MADGLDEMRAARHRKKPAYTKKTPPQPAHPAPAAQPAPRAPAPPTDTAAATTAAAAASQATPTQPQPGPASKAEARAAREALTAAEAQMLLWAAAQRKAAARTTELTRAITRAAKAGTPTSLLHRVLDEAQLRADGHRPPEVTWAAASATRTPPATAGTTQPHDHAT